MLSILIHTTIRYSNPLHIYRGRKSKSIFQNTTVNVKVNQLKQKEKAEEIKGKQRISATDAKKTEEYKSWNVDLLAEYASKVDELKNRLTEEYQLARQRELVDYPIFMAIAENIGYDATGKKTAVNELDVIGEELKKFISTL